MYCIAKAAISSDGFLDDSLPERRIFSGQEDRQAVFELRSKVDAILIGATTLRSDDPSLTYQDPMADLAPSFARTLKAPRAVVLSNSGVLPTDRKLFTNKPEKQLPLIFCSEACWSTVARTHRGVAEVLPLVRGSRQTVEEVLDQLKERGVNSLLVEGGAKILAMFLASGKVSLLRLAVSPIFLGASGRANLFQECTALGFNLADLELVPDSLRQLDDLRVGEYRYREVLDTLGS